MKALKSKLSKSRFTIAAIIAVATTVLVVGLTLAIRTHLRNRREQALTIRQQLETELNNIAGPPGTNQMRHVNAFRGTHGNIENYYKTNLTSDEIRIYYDRELQRRGWKLIGEKKLTTWGQDLGESLRIYCKQPLAADIYFTGKNESTLGFRYSLSMSWRIVDECGS